MVSLSDRAARLRAQVEQSAPAATWSDPSDLARRALESVWGADLPGRQVASEGTLHLAGAGVEGSSARLSAVGDVMTGFQRLITAVGAAHEGFRGLRGNFPAVVLARTQLRLVASPGIGSVVLDFEPEMPPASELSPDGQAPLFGEQRKQLTDLAVEEAFDLLVAARDLGPDADEGAFLARVAAHGPRVASCLREFTKSLSAADFDADVSWREPGEPTRRARIPAADAGRIAGLIASRELDHGEAEIVGTIHTVSDRTALAVETDDGDYVYVRGSKLSADALRGITWGSRVRVVADVVEEQRAGGDAVLRYTAKVVTSIEGTKGASTA